MINEEIALIPTEYQFLMESIPHDKTQSLTITWNRLERTKDPYYDLSNAILETLKVWREPDHLLLYIASRITFCQSDYDLIKETYETYPNSEGPMIYLARSLIYQTKFEEALALVDKVLLKTDLERDPQLYDVVVGFDALFTKGLIQVYTRDFQNLDETIKFYEELTDLHKIKKWIPRNEFANFLIPPYLLSTLKSLYTAQYEDMKQSIQSVDNWFDSVTDLWYRGFYLNLAGISSIMANNVARGIKQLREAMETYKNLGDRRDFTVVGANLAVTLILQGKRKDGRDVLEGVAKTLEELKNYNLALNHTLIVSKLYLDEKKIRKARFHLSSAERILRSVQAVEPPTFSYFATLYSKLHEREKAEDFLNRLKDLVDDEFFTLRGELVIPERKAEKDYYTLIWYLNAKSVFSMSFGNLLEANETILKALSIAEKENMYDSIIELTTIQLEVLLKQFLVEQSEELLDEAIEALEDLRPLISNMDNLYFNTLIYLVEIYLLIAKNELSHANNLSEEVQDLYLRVPTELIGDQSYEMELVLKRLDSVSRKLTPEEEEIGHNVWFLGNNYMRYIATLEAMRLINDLQMQQAAFGDKPEQKMAKPTLVLISKSTGQSVFSLKLREDDQVDEQLISALLMAISSFSKEVLGGGSLNKIEQEGHILLLEHIGGDYTAVIVAEEDSYSLRKKFKSFIQDLKMLRIVELFGIDTLLSEGDPQYGIIENLVLDTFN